MPMRHGIPGGILWRGADVSRYNRGSGSRMCAHGWRRLCLTIDVCRVIRCGSRGTGQPVQRTAGKRSAKVFSVHHTLVRDVK